MDDKFQHVYKMLDLKADKADMDLMERRLTDFIRSFLDRFADKKDVAKKLAQIDSKINALLEMILSQQNRENEDDAMFTKKPLGGVSCASCEKNIVNLEGMQADFLSWRRLPFKENHERISKFGPGFSKILQSLRPASITVTNSELNQQSSRTHYHSQMQSPYSPPHRQNHPPTKQGRLIEPLKSKEGNILASQKHNRTASSNMFPATTSNAANIRENSKTTNKHSRDTAGWNKSTA
jgi:hypothetical protein